MVKKYYFARLRNFLYLRYVDWRNSRLARKKRHWVAHKMDGGGVVAMGKVNQFQATAKVSSFGSLIYIDEEHAMIMYRDKQ